jgi:hypothetical protein
MENLSQEPKHQKNSTLYESFLTQCRTKLVKLVGPIEGDEIYFCGENL